MAGFEDSIWAFLRSENSTLRVAHHSSRARRKIDHGVPFGVRRLVAAVVLADNRDKSRQTKAATSRRTPKSGHRQIDSCSDVEVDLRQYAIRFAQSPVSGRLYQRRRTELTISAGTARG